MRRMEDVSFASLSVVPVTFMEVPPFFFFPFFLADGEEYNRAANALVWVLRKEIAHCYQSPHAYFFLIYQQKLFNRH